MNCERWCYSLFLSINQKILLIGIQNILHFLWVFTTSAVACLAFASATQRYMLTRTSWWEVILLLTAMVFLFHPDISQDRLFPSYREPPPSKVTETVAALQPGEVLRLRMLTEFYTGKLKDQVVVLPFKGETAEERFERGGVILSWEGAKLMGEDVLISSHLEKMGVNMDDPTEVLGIEAANTDRPAKWLFSIPGLGLLP